MSFIIMCGFAWITRNSGLANKQTPVSSYMKMSINTVNKYINFVQNPPTYDYNNGVLEGINNYIEVISRIAFEYRCSYQFRNNYPNFIVNKKGIEAFKSPLSLRITFATVTSTIINIKKHSTNEIFSDFFYCTVKKYGPKSPVCSKLLGRFF